MLISFILYSSNSVDIFSTIDSLNKQTNQNFELFIIEDASYKAGNNINYLYNLITENWNKNSKIHLICNSKSNGFYKNAATAISESKGKYIIFLKEAQIIEENFVNNFEIANKKYKNVELYEFNLKQSFFDVKEFNKNNIIYDKILNLNDNPELITTYDTTMYNKAFSANLISNNNLFMQKSDLRPIAYIYKSLFMAKSYCRLDINMGSENSEESKYSSFYMLKQWSHVFNMFRINNKYFEFIDELNYIYLKYILFKFIPMNVNSDNIFSIKKAVKIASLKIKRRKKQFINNKYIQKDENPAFHDVIHNTNEYFKKILS